jgi:hypothetical protein
MARVRWGLLSGGDHHEDAHDVLAQFDVGLDLPRRDELELIGSSGKLTIPDPRLCRRGYIELERDGHGRRLPADPSGTFGLAHPDHDVYRIELETISAAIAGREQPSFGRADVVDQATVLQPARRPHQSQLAIGWDGLTLRAGRGRRRPSQRLVVRRRPAPSRTTRWGAITSFPSAALSSSRLARRRASCATVVSLDTSQRFDRRCGVISIATSRSPRARLASSISLARTGWPRRLAACTQSASSAAMTRARPSTVDPTTRPRWVQAAAAPAGWPGCA